MEGHWGGGVYCEIDQASVRSSEKRKSTHNVLVGCKIGTSGTDLKQLSEIVVVFSCMSRPKVFKLNKWKKTRNYDINNYMNKQIKYRHKTVKWFINLIFMYFLTSCFFSYFCQFYFQLFFYFKNLFYFMNPLLIVKSFNFLNQDKQGRVWMWLVVALAWISRPKFV